MLKARDPGDEAMEFIHCPFMVTSPPRAGGLLPG